MNWKKKQNYSTRDFFWGHITELVHAYLIFLYRLGNTFTMCPLLDLNLIILLCVFYVFHILVFQKTVYYKIIEKDPHDKTWKDRIQKVKIILLFKGVSYVIQLPNFFILFNFHKCLPFLSLLNLLMAVIVSVVIFQWFFIYFLISKW